MTEMIERVARAICTARGCSPDTLFQHNEWDEWPEDGHFVNSRGERCPMHYGWRKFIKEARAAIDAMASPVDLAIEAAADVALTSPYVIGPDASVCLTLAASMCSAYHRAMIDGALGKPAQPAR